MKPSEIFISSRRQDVTPYEGAQGNTITFTRNTRLLLKIQTRFSGKFGSGSIQKEKKRCQRCRSTRVQILMFCLQRQNSPRNDSVGFARPSRTSAIVTAVKLHTCIKSAVTGQASVTLEWENTYPTGNKKGKEKKWCTHIVKTKYPPAMRSKA